MNYFILAKRSLIVVSAILGGIFLATTFESLRGRLDFLQHAISSGQALSVIAVSVMGYYLSDDKHFPKSLRRNAEKDRQDEREWFDRI